MKCNETPGKWCKNKHGASKIIDTFETYQEAPNQIQGNDWVRHGLAPMTTTHIVHSCYEEWLIWRDISTKETTLLRLNLQRIR
jgi:hypothetical protein